MRWPWESRGGGRNAIASGLSPSAGPGGDITFRAAWRLDDPKIEADAKAFWARLKALPPDVDPEARVKELVVAAYLGDRLVAVETAAVETSAHLRCRMATLRCLVGPGMRERSLSLHITDRARVILQQWSLENPQEEVMGILAVLEATTYNKKPYPPRVRENGLSLVGFTPQGRKIMVAWFDHALI